MTETNKNYKDRLFRRIFKEKENILALYNAMNHSNYTDLDQLEILDNENDVIYLNYKGDVSFIIDPCLFLYEHQSSYNPNMGVRGLIYFAQMYNSYMEKHNLNRFGSKLLRLPVPKFVVFYNGTTWQEEETEIRLSDCFARSAGEPCVEVVAKMININYGKNKELMEHCKPLRDYAIFVNTVRCYVQTMELRLAVTKAIDDCIKQDCLKEFLIKYRSEVLELMMDSYSLENYQKIVEYEKHELEGKINELQTSNAELQTSNAELQTSNAELQNSYAEAKTVIGELKNENTEVKTENTELKNKNAELQEIIEQMQKQMQEMRKE
ncbi:MAG: hypothetical protein II073_06380 [Lachnospiraceae bacterium]|nr:hypothetical protein [Lachnospiraceae bacterium]